MTNNIPDMMSGMVLSPLKPELFLAGVGLLLLLLGAFRGNASLNFILSAVVASFVVAIGFTLQSDWSPIDTLGGMVLMDGFAGWMKVLVLSGLSASLLLSVSWLRENSLLRFEYPLLVLFSGIGMMLMLSANNFLALYVSLELSSLCLYVLAAIRRDDVLSSEAGVKYFVLGALSSGLLLFGISLVYGFTGTTSYALVAQTLGSAEEIPLGAIVGMVFILAGLAFKISAVPFHMWTPDVYQGAPTPVTALFAIVPKVAAFGLIIRLLFGPFEALGPEWTQIISFMAVASMVWGGFAGVAQTNFKRLLAYSSIANMGYALIGLLPGVPEGVGAVILYLTIYMVMTAGLFAVLMGLRRNGQSLETISDFAGLSQTSPFYAYILAALMFSMSGIPPLAGFFSKLFVFQAAVAGGYIAVAVIGVLASVVASYYYLRVVKVMFFDEPVLPLEKTCSWSRKIVAAASLAFILLFTLMPNALFDRAQAAAASLFQ